MLLQFLNKIDRPELKPAVWKGAFTGLAGAIAIGVCFIIAYYETNEQFFKGETEYIVEAILVRTKCTDCYVYIFVVVCNGAAITVALSATAVTLETFRV